MYVGMNRPAVVWQSSRYRVPHVRGDEPFGGDEPKLKQFAFPMYVGMNRPH